MKRPNGDRLADADLSMNMHDFYPVEIESTSPTVYHSLSFWTGRNRMTTKSDVFAGVMGGISPQQTNLALDNVRTARDLVTILLGEGTNRWSNIELASGFYTALTGNLLVPHIVSMKDKTDPAPRNAPPEDVRGKLERGLNGVVTWKGATATDKMKDAVNVYRKQGGFELYARRERWRRVIQDRRNPILVPHSSCHNSAPDGRRKRAMEWPANRGLCRGCGYGDRLEVGQRFSRGRCPAGD